MKYLVVAILLGGCVAAPVADKPSLAQVAPERMPCASIIEAWDQNVKALAAARTAASVPFFVGTAFVGHRDALSDRQSRLAKRKRECGV